MFLRVRGKDQYNFTKRGWHKGSISSFFSDLFGGDDEIEVPDFTVDPRFEETQDILQPFGEKLLAGDVPDFFKPIGNIGGKAFEDFLGMNIRDVQRVIGEDLARRGVRGPRGSKILAETTADVTTNLRFQDLLKGIEGRKFLLESGANILSGVRGTSLEESGLENKFNLARAGLEFDISQIDTGISDIISSGFGAAGNLFALSQLDKKDSVGTQTAQTKIRGSAGTGAFGASQEEINALFRNIRR